MPFSDILRETIVGQAVNSLSKGRLLPYPEERPDFVVPERFRLASAKGTSKNLSPEATLVPQSATTPSRLPGSHPLTDKTHSKDQETLTDATAHHAVEKATHATGDKIQGEKQDSQGNNAAAQDLEDPYLVGWYSDDDPGNPQNWSNGRKTLLMVMLQLLTFTVYIGSAIITPSLGGIMQEFNVSQTKAILALSLYVLAYGIGPMIFSPLSEIPSFGRLNVYMVTFFIFMILQIPTALAPNYSTLMAMRFFAGLVCSPALSTGGATLGDVFKPMTIPYVMALWAAGAVAGPVIGPVAAGFAAMKENWRWPLYMLLFLSVFSFVLLSFLFEETSSSTILLRRAQRLRKLTGNDKLRSAGEIEQAEMSFAANLRQSLWRPFLLLTEPVVLFIDGYIALVYAIFYLWFEAFPIVFTEMYSFNLGLSGLPFVGFVVALVPTVGLYFAYQKYSVIPKFQRTGVLVPESRLLVALVGSAFIPVALFIFGWSAGRGHWMGPIVGASLYLPGIYLIFQGAIVYLPMSYGKYAASVLAGNALLRGISGAAFPLFGHQFFVGLGIGGGSSLLAGLSILMIPPLYYLYKHGDRIRARSKYAN